MSFLALNISKDFQGILNSNHLVNFQTLNAKKCQFEKQFRLRYVAQMNS